MGMDEWAGLSVKIIEREVASTQADRCDRMVNGQSWTALITRILFRIHLEVKRRSSRHFRKSQERALYCINDRPNRKSKKDRDL